MNNHPEKLKIITSDPWLEPFVEAIKGRHDDILARWNRIAGAENAQALSDFANAHQYFGLHRLSDGSHVFREFAPGATQIYLTGTFSSWTLDARFRLTRIEGTGVWELHIPQGLICHGDLYKMHVTWPGGAGERIPAYATRVVQDPQTAIFSAQVWEPPVPYQWHNAAFTPDERPLLIYECHIGMAQEEEKIGSYTEFRTKVLPRIAADGYTAIQIMGIQEHPYYGSFGYHVSSFFAPSSRFGTPDELRQLIDDAHTLGLAVIMDLVHSHAVKNLTEGLASIDGDPSLYFYPGDKGLHPAWDSLCFDYGKDSVIHFLLSNCKYWLEEFRFDGFRFDGVTSMIYLDHGLGKAFSSYADYYDGNQDTAALEYLALANILIHHVNHKAITIAEEMSGLPGLALPVSDGGYGFDYRMAMGIPDFWIKLIKQRKDEDWKPSQILYELTNRRPDEKTVSYCESHDQALVGDKTIIFRLIDQDMYWHMQISDQNPVVARGMALHKLIRLVTLATINGAYLNFMGNEFGHPEWIDFPRQGNNWSHKYARRQWSLVDRQDLKYKALNAFDNQMIELIHSVVDFQSLRIDTLCVDDERQILAFMRGDLIFIFNFNPVNSFTDYAFPAPPGAYTTALDSDSPSTGGQGNIDPSVTHFTIRGDTPDSQHLSVYLPARSAQVLRRKHNPKAKPLN